MSKFVSMMDPWEALEAVMRQSNNCPDDYFEIERFPESYGSECIEVKSDLIVDFKNVEVGPMYSASRGMITSYKNKDVDIDKDTMVGYCLKVNHDSIYLEYVLGENDERQRVSKLL